MGLGGGGVFCQGLTFVKASPFLKVPPFVKGSHVAFVCVVVCGVCIGWPREPEGITMLRWACTCRMVDMQDMFIYVCIWIRCP